MSLSLEKHAFLIKYIIIVVVVQDLEFYVCALSLLSDLGSIGEGSLSRSTSQSSGLSVSQKVRVRTIFPHTAGNSDTLLSFDQGEIISLLMHDEQDGWLYGELERTQQ